MPACYVFYHLQSASARPYNPLQTPSMALQTPPKRTCKPISNRSQTLQTHRTATPMSPKRASQRLRWRSARRKRLSKKPAPSRLPITRSRKKNWRRFRCLGNRVRRLDPPSSPILPANAARAAHVPARGMSRVAASLLLLAWQIKADTGVGRRTGAQKRPGWDPSICLGAIRFDRRPSALGRCPQ